METFVQDLRYSLRTLAKAPGYTAVAVLTLALGVGANAAIFSVLQAVVLRDLPYRDPDRITVMWTRNIRQNLPDGTSYLNFRDWKAQSRQFEAMAVYRRPEFTRNTLGGTDTARIQVGLVGQGFFELLGAAPLVGRTFAPTDFSATPRAVVISHGLWQQRFAGDPAVVGTSVPLGDATVEIIGVMPREFELPTDDVQLWQPLWFGPEAEKEGDARSGDGLVVIGRLAPSATIGSAPRRAGRHRRRSADAPPHDQRRLRRHHRPAGRSRHRRDDRAVAVAALRGGRVRGADCVHQRRQPGAVARGRAPPRVLAAHGAGRRHRAAGAAGADREPRAGAPRGRRRPAARLGGHPGAPGARAWRPAPGRQHPDGRGRGGVPPGDDRGVRAARGSAAGAAALDGQARRCPARSRSAGARRRRPACAPGARGGRDRAGGRADGGRRPAHSQLRARAVGEPRLRFEQRPAAAGRSAAHLRQPAEVGGVLQRGDTARARPARRPGRGRDLGLLHPSTARLSHRARGAAAAPSGRARAPVDRGQRRARVFRGDAHPGDPWPDAGRERSRSRERRRSS